MKTAEAPSFSGEEFPAVTVPSAANAGLSLASASRLVSGRRLSSRRRSVPATGTTQPS